jgi:hypothetical protein
MHIEQNAKGINEKKIDSHHDSRFLKTNYLKTNLLKQIKKISFSYEVLYDIVYGFPFDIAKLGIFLSRNKHSGKKLSTILI